MGQFDGIMTISGDGLIHEAINGVMQRPDKD
jgi:sphingosine kinase